MALTCLSELHDAIAAAGIPLDGISADGRIDFKPGATPEQREQARAIVQNFDPLVAEKAEADGRIDAWAEAERARWRTPNMSETYAQKQRDVDTWRRIEASGGTPAIADVPYAARRAARKTGLAPDQLDLVTSEMLAATIAEYEQAIAGLRIVDLNIEDAREAAKEAVAAAMDAAGVEAALAGLGLPGQQ